MSYGASAVRVRCVTELATFGTCVRVWCAQPEAAFTVEEDDIQSLTRVSIWASRELQGMVLRTYVRGNVVFDRDLGVGVGGEAPSAPFGRMRRVRESFGPEGPQGAVLQPELEKMVVP